MSQAAYDILLYAARYWFAALALLVAALAVLATVREQRIQRDIRRRIEKVRLTAVLTLAREAGKDLAAGRQWTVSGPSVAGRGRSCDIRLRHKSIARRHARLIPEEDCLRVVALSGSDVYLDGRKLQREEGLILGSGELRLGELVFAVRTGGEQHEA